MARKVEKQHAAFGPIMELLERDVKMDQLNAGSSVVWTRTVGEHWAVSVNVTQGMKRVQHGTMNMGVILPAGGIAIWHDAWLIGVLTKQGSTWLPPIGVSLGDLLSAIESTKVQKGGA